MGCMPPELMLVGNALCTRPSITGFWRLYPELIEKEGFCCACWLKGTPPVITILWFVLKGFGPRCCALWLYCTGNLLPKWALIVVRF